MKNNIIQYYENTRLYYGTYHNHKEVSAWAGLALYVLFVGLVNWVILPDKYMLLSLIILSVFVIVVSILVYRYISAQIEMKDLAGAYSATAFIFLSELIAKDMNEEELKKYMNIEDSADTKAQSSHVLPKIFLLKSEIMNTRGRGFQDTTRSMIYSILILVTVLILVVKWINILG